VASGAPTHSGPPIARFTLVLAAAPSDTQSFVLYLQTGPSAPTESVLCGPAPAPPCNPARSPFRRVVRGLPAGTTLVFRIERIAPNGVIDVLLQGSQVFQQGMPEEIATYRG